MSRLAAEVNENVIKNRKEAVDPNLRYNLIKKIEEKFKENL